MTNIHQTELQEALIKALSEFILIVNDVNENTNVAEDRPIYQIFLATAAIISALIINGKPLTKEIDLMEHNIGQTWIKDQNSYNKITISWRLFTDLLK